MNVLVQIDARRNEVDACLRAVVADVADVAENVVRQPDGAPTHARAHVVRQRGQTRIEQAGTYRLPEAQLDRFMMRASLGYPDHAATVRILDGAAVPVADLAPIITPEALVGMADLAAQVYVDALVLDYVARLVDSTRSADEVRLGVSIRGALALTHAARTRAASQGRTYATPDDVKALAVAVLSHRLILHPEAEFDGVTQEAVIGQVLLDVAHHRADARPYERDHVLASAAAPPPRASPSDGRSRVASHAHRGRDPDGRTQVTSTSVTTARRGRALVGAVVWWAGAWRATREALVAAAEWSARTVRPAGVLVAPAATAGSSSGSRSAGSSGWSPVRSRCSSSLASVPFLFGARSYDVDLSLAHERVVAGDGVTGEIRVRNHGRRIALPGRIDMPVGDGLVEFGVPLLRPGHIRSRSRSTSRPSAAGSSPWVLRPRCAATRSACFAASTRSTTSTSCMSTRARRPCRPPAPV